MSLSRAQVFAFVDASPHALTWGWHMLVLVDDENEKAALLGWMSRKHKRKCTRPILHAETFAAIDAEFHAQSAKTIVAEVLKLDIGLDRQQVFW